MQSPPPLQGSGQDLVDHSTERSIMLVGESMELREFVERRKGDALELSTVAASKLACGV